MSAESRESPGIALIRLRISTAFAARELFQPAPRSEGRQQPRGNLWVGSNRATPPRRRPARIPRRPRRANWVGLPKAKLPISARTRFGLVMVKAGCPCSARDALQRAGLGDLGLDGEPLVEDEGLVGVARGEARQRGLARSPRGSAPAWRGRRGGRSCWWRRRGAAPARAAPASGIARGDQVERGVARATGARPRRHRGCRSRRAAGASAASIRSRRGRSACPEPRRSADRGPRGSRRGRRRPGIASAASPSLGSGQDQGREGRVGQGLAVEERAERVARRPRPVGMRAIRGSAAAPRPAPPASG